MNLFGRLASVINKLPWVVVGAGVIFASVAGIFGGSVSQSLQSGGFQDPGSQSSQAVARLESASGLRSDGGIIALVTTANGISATDSVTEVTKVAQVIATESQIDHVLTYYVTHSPLMVSTDGKSTIVVGTWKRISDQEATLAAGRLATALKSDPNVKLGGFASVNNQLNTTVTGDLGRAELLAFPILFLLSLWVFRGLIAALLPPMVGGIVILLSFLFLRGVTDIHPVSIFALNLVTGMGLGLAIDSSLFILSRYREEMAQGAEPSVAIERTLRTAGRSVLFSSLTIAAAMASLTVFPINFLWSMGVGGIIVALCAGLVSLTVLPAVLRLLGHRVNSLAPRRWQRSVSGPSEARGFWYRLSWFVMRRPVPVAVLSAVVLIALGLPFLGIRFNSVDVTSLPSSLAARQVDEALHRDFGAPSGSTINVVVEAPASDADKVLAFARGFNAVANVTAISAPQLVADGTWTIDVQTPGGNFDPATLAVVRDIRAEAVPFTVLVDGQAAQFVDLQASLSSHLPLAIAIVAIATVVLLFLMTGSVVLPIKAVLMNLLTLSAAFGVLVLIFQDGNFESLLGFKSQGALESTQPVLLFAIVFGLSTDYGVYLLTRIKEAHDAGLPNSEAVAAGLQRTGRIITAAALLFCVAIGAFATSQVIFIKELGIGIAAGVIVDATVVRGLLVPSLMALLGNWNWWAPRPLRWLYRRAGVSEAAPEPV
jgi:uncharacterized membrane protein YdfJ with MMPL/SSD domain